MAPQIERITTLLNARASSPTDAAAAQINQLIAPSSSLAPDDIYVAAMYLISDEVNSFGGCFPVEEHPRVAELLVDAPVMVGHRKDRLPIGRIFSAELVERDSHQWVKCNFYWLKRTDGAETLKANIEGGIYKECSIAFTYNLPECSICGQDIRICEHEPLQQYPVNEGSAICHYNYRHIERVLEASLVYRGAVPNTLVTGASDQTSQTHPALTPPSLLPIADLSGLDQTHLYVVVPRYESIPVSASADHGSLSIRRLDGRPVGSHMYQELIVDPNSNLDSHPALLIGYRGRDRCRLGDLERYLADRSGPVTRIVMALYPDINAGMRPKKMRSTFRSVRTLPYQIVDHNELRRGIAQLATKLGVEIWPLSADLLSESGFIYQPNSTSGNFAGERYLFKVDRAAASAVLVLQTKFGEMTFSIPNFDRRQFTPGARFVADRMTEPHVAVSQDNRATHSGHIKLVQKTGDGLAVTLSGPLNGTFIIRPIIIGGRTRHLLTCTISRRQFAEVLHA